MKLHIWFTKADANHISVKSCTYFKNILWHQFTALSKCKKLISRDFSLCTYSQCGNLQNFPHDFFCKNFVKLTFSLELYCKSIWRKIFVVGENFRNFHTVRKWRKRIFHDFCSKNFVKTILSIKTTLKNDFTKNCRISTLSGPFNSQNGLLHFKVHELDFCLLRIFLNLLKEICILTMNSNIHSYSYTLSKVQQCEQIHVPTKHYNDT